MEQKKSRMLRLTLMGGQARVFICDTTEMAQQARDIHNASNTCSAAMGRMLAATAIMGANLKRQAERRRRAGQGWPADRYAFVRFRRTVCRTRGAGFRRNRRGFRHVLSGIRADAFPLCAGYAGG